MAKIDPLAQLKDIHLPEPIHWWPLAPGWYVVLAVIVLFSLVVIGYISKRKRYALPKKQALALLNTYKKEYEISSNAPLISSQIAELLKRVALVYFPRVQVAGMTGAEWLAFLNNTAKGVDFKSVQELLLELPFKKSELVAQNPIELTELFRNAELWIKQRGVPCSN